jgi:hypothetical protein
VRLDVQFVKQLLVLVVLAKIGGRWGRHDRLTDLNKRSLLNVQTNLFWV